MLEYIKNKIKDNFKLIKFEDERKEGNGFLYIFTTGTINILGEDIEKILRYKDELEDNFDINWEIEYDENSEEIKILLSGI